MQPLAGIKIISTAFNLPGPAAVSQMHRFGAEVLKIEPPSGDPMARNSPDFYQYLLARQQVRRLDLKNPDERRQLDEHLAVADLLVTSTLPSSLERLGLGWNSLHEQYPRLCQVAIVGYAPPNVEITGHDLTYQASVGLLSPPTMPKTLLADMAAAQTAVTHAMGVLLERSRTGAGVFSYVPIAGAVEFFTLPLRFKVTTPGGRLSGVQANYNLYPTKEGWLAVGALEPQFWAKLQELLGLKDATYDDLKAKFAARTASQWETWAEENRLPLAAVRE